MSSEPADPATAPLHAGLAFRIGRTHRVLRAAWASRIADLGVTPPQAALMRGVAEQPGSGLRSLARLLATDPMNAKRVVDHLERQGLVRSAGDPADRRRRALWPTEAGLALAGTLAERAQDWNDEITAILSPAGSRQLGELLGRIESTTAAAHH